MHLILTEFQDYWMGGNFSQCTYSTVTPNYPKPTIRVNINNKLLKVWTNEVTHSLFRFSCLGTFSLVFFVLHLSFEALIHVFFQACLLHIIYIMYITCDFWHHVHCIQMHRVLHIMNQSSRNEQVKESHAYFLFLQCTVRIEQPTQHRPVVSLNQVWHPSAG